MRRHDRRVSPAGAFHVGDDGAGFWQLIRGSEAVNHSITLVLRLRAQRRKSGK